MTNKHGRVSKREKQDRRSYQRSKHKERRGAKRSARFTATLRSSYRNAFALALVFSAYMFVTVPTSESLFPFRARSGLAAKSLANSHIPIKNLVIKVNKAKSFKVAKKVDNGDDDADRFPASDMMPVDFGTPLDVGVIDASEEFTTRLKPRTLEH